MNKPTPFDRSTLLVVKEGVDATLSELSTHLDVFLQAPVDDLAALAKARSELGRLLGVCKMIHLDGVAVYCAELDRNLAELAANPALVSPLHREELRAALSALTRYMDDLAQGAENATLRLFPNYQQLQQMRGLELAFELDLFYPELAINLPEAVTGIVQVSDPQARQKVARTQYQQALLRYLRQDDTEGALVQMQHAVDEVMCTLPPDDSRAIWWVSSGLIDCVRLDGLPPEFKPQKLLGRIDQQMRVLVQGDKSDDRALFNEMLFFVGRSHSVSERVSNIKRSYALEDYLPTLSTLSPAELNKRLAMIAEQLRGAEEYWELCVRGDQSLCESFIAQTETMEQHSEMLEHDTLQYLAKQIAKAAQYASKPEHAQPIAMDMAMALLLLGKSIVHYRVLDSRFQEQARLLSERMQAAISGRRVDEQQFAQVVGLYCQVEKSDVLVSLCNEMLVNLHHVEQNLNAFFVDINKRPELHGLQRWMGQIQGGLRMLSLDEAAQLLTAFQDNVRQLEHGEGVVDPVESRAMANALGTLERYLQHLPNRQQLPVDELLAALGELNSRQQVEAPVEYEPEDKAKSEPAASRGQRGEDDELVEIFLEEAQEVLETLRASLKECRLHHANREPMVTVRRSFHTLKGSGRMVGLTDLGEVAWAIERALNKWLDAEKPASDSLLNFIELAVNRFAGWIEALSSGGNAVVEAVDIFDMAKTVENGQELQDDITPAPELDQIELAETMPGAAGVPAATAIQLAAADERVKPEPVQPVDHQEAVNQVEPEFVEIGAIRLSTTLFKIGSEESRQHVETLQRELEALRTTQLPVIHLDFMRAAHTLAGVNRAMGFSAVVDLAYALEAWLQARMDKSFGLHEEQQEMLSRAVDALHLMVQCICNREIPQGRIELAQQLLEDRDNLHADAETLLQPADSADVATEAADKSSQDQSIQALELSPVEMALEEPKVEPVSGSAETEMSTRPEWATTLALDAAELETATGSVAVESAFVQPVDNGTEARDRSSPDQSIQALELSPVEMALEEPMVEPVSGSDETEIGIRPEWETALALDAPELEVTTDTVLQERTIVQQETTSDQPKKEANEEQQVNAEFAQTYAPYVPPYIDPNFGSEAEEKPEAIAESAIAVPIAFEAPVKTTEVVVTPLVQAAVEKAQVHDDVDEQLLAVFLEEANELCPKIGESVRAWKETPGDDQYSQLLKRLLHTLKGSARMAGAMRIGEVAHEMEDRVLTSAQQSGQPGYWDALENDLDRINSLMEELRGGSKEQAVETKETKAEAKQTEIKRRALEQVIGERRAERNPLSNMLRVRADMVDRLVNDAGEISVARSRIETELNAFKDGLLELTGSVSRLRRQLREVEIQAESQMQSRISLTHDSEGEFDPLEFDRFTRLQELTRFMNESVHDVQTVQQALLKNLDETSAALFSQARLNLELQQGLMGVRMVPFDSIGDRLYRIVRQTGKELNKRANLELQGGRVELDRSVLEKMTAPFEHLLRNAIAHGLENEALRAQRGKRPIGEIRLSLRQESNEVVFELSDDGAGLNFAALRENAISHGLLQADENLSEEQLAQLIFVAGITTADKVSEIAGRGIGMDVVRSEIASLGGRIDVNSKSGLGTHFVIHLPLTLAVTQTLMVRSDEATYAIPAAMVENVRQVKSADMEGLYRERQVEWQGKTYPLHYLPQMLGDIERVPANQARNTILLLHSGEQRIALHVDELLGNQESVVKDIGPQLSRLAGVAGATVLGNGQVVLILNPIQMAQRIVTETHKPMPTTAELLRSQPIVMVVDDSLTVRKITSRMLLRAGYQVVTAKDGVDALEQLADVTPAVMLLDVEMPRMDGFELAKQLRRDEKTKDLPIIMITSRTATKHRDYALQIGVNAYMGKPYQEEEILQRIAGFVGAAQPA